MKLKVLGSSSKGNCYLLESSDSALIIECGIRFKEVQKLIDFKVSKIHGALVSHSHEDHSKYIKSFLDYGISVYTGYETIKAKKLKHHRLIPVSSKLLFEIGNFKIKPFDLKHDVPCLGFLVSNKESGTIVFITDTHYVPYKFPNLNNILIECNYSDKILDHNIFSGKLNSKVRNRVVKSHISLDVCKGFLKANDLTNVNNIILLHLSDGNSNAKEFKEDIEGLTGKSTYIADHGLEINIDRTPF